MLPCILCSEPTDRHHPACLDYEEDPEPRYFLYTQSPEEDRLAWILIKLCQGWAPDKIPVFPLDREPSKVSAGTGLFGAVKAAVSVAELAGRFTELRAVTPGKLRGKCPLHQERTGSFYVFEAEDGGPERWRCFGACARGGDVIELARLLMDRGLLT